MATNLIVKYFNVFEDGKACFVVSREIFVMHQLGFQRAKKNFRHGFVSAVVLVAHIKNHAMAFEQFLKIVTAAIAVMGQARWRPMIFDRYRRCVHHQVPIDPIAQPELQFRSFPKKAAVFFKMPHSIHSRRFSSWNRRISSSRDTLSPYPETLHQPFAAIPFATSRRTIGAIVATSTWTASPSKTVSRKQNDLGKPRWSRKIYESRKLCGLPPRGQHEEYPISQAKAQNQMCA